MYFYKMHLCNAWAAAASTGSVQYLPLIRYGEKMPYNTLQTDF